MAVQAVIFDLDGTIWDSHPLYQRALEHCSGRSAASVPARLLEGASIVRLLTEFRVGRGCFVEALLSAAENALFPGVRDSVQKLATRGVSLGVHTSLPGWIAEPLLEASGLAPHFGHAVLHASNCKPRKPNPAGIIAALRVLALPHSQHVYYVGDRQVDSDTADRAGVRFAWAKYGYGECEPTKTHVVLNQPSDLCRL